MQKKNPKTAHRAKTGKTGKAGEKAGRAKTLTDAQRAAKRLRDRKYRARVRAEAKAGKSGHGAQPPQATQVPEDVFTAIGRLVVSAHVAQLCEAASKPVQVEPGVVRQEVSLPGGRRASVVLVDADKVDPLSEYSPLPPDVRRVLLRRRMAKEISDIVDSHLELS